MTFERTEYNTRLSLFITQIQQNIDVKHVNNKKTTII
jgi:hypothetical protein